MITSAMVWVVKGFNWEIIIRGPGVYANISSVYSEYFGAIQRHWTPSNPMVTMKL